MSHHQYKRVPLSPSDMGGVDNLESVQVHGDKDSGKRTDVEGIRLSGCDTNSDPYHSQARRRGGQRPHNCRGELLVGVGLRAWHDRSETLRCVYAPSRPTRCAARQCICDCHNVLHARSPCLLCAPQCVAYYMHSHSLRQQRFMPSLATTAWKPSRLDLYLAIAPNPHSTPDALVCRCALALP